MNPSGRAVERDGVGDGTGGIEPCRRLVEEAFAAHFPQWNRMSPFDPVKLVAEGVTGALAAAERRHRRLLDGVLDAMPTLFGFEPRPARLPVGLFRVRSPERTIATVRLADRAFPRLRSPRGVFVLLPAEDATVTPVGATTTRREGTDVTVTVVARAALSELLLTFLPDPGADRVVSGVRVLRWTIRADGQESDHETLLVEDGTGGLAHFGTVRLRRRDGKALRSDGGALSVTVACDRAPGGTLTTNVVPMAFGHRREEVSLGYFGGEAWESKPLPPTLVGVPDAILVRYPDGRRRSLTRLSEDPLRAAHGARTEWTEGYLYDGIRHELLFPAADRLVGQWNGGVEVLLPEGLFSPETPWIPEGAEPALGDASAYLEALEPVAPLSPAAPREAVDRFLERFYATLRRAAGGNGEAPPFRARECALRALEAVPALSAVELAVDGDTLRAHCLAEDPRGEGAFRLSPGLVAATRRSLEAELPLRFALDVVPFRPEAFHATVALTLRLGEARFATVDDGALVAAVRKGLDELLLPAPFGALEADDGRTSAELERLLRGKLAALVADDEVAAVRLGLRSAAGEFLREVRRALGTCPILSVQVDVERRRATEER
jgi:hypothetical protein